MPSAATLLFFAAVALLLSGGALCAERQTVCTITVNSPDEKEAMRAGLQPERFRFVELVEKGRPDWLASACHRGIRCDVLVISGHYDGGNEFFSDRIDAREFLPVDELERVSCGASCPGLFSRLKEVYLFGCNTLNAQSPTSVLAEIERSLLRSGHTRAEAQRLTRALSARQQDSSRDRMRLIFKGVPAIYGFSSVAPLGPTAAFRLGQYFRTAGPGEIGNGRPNARLLAAFAAHSMVVTAGIAETGPEAALRRDVCQFSDDRHSTAQRLAFVHRLLDRDVTEARLFLDRIESVAASLSAADRLSPAVAKALQAIAEDDRARQQFMDFARSVDRPAVRARMIGVAHDLGWLTIHEQRAELARMIGELLAAGAVTAAEVDLVCTLNRNHELDPARAMLHPSPAHGDKIAEAAVLACMGAADARARMLKALTSTHAEDVRLAQVYFRHRPITDVNELRAVTAGVTQMTDAAAQVRALNALARHHLSDRECLDRLARLYHVTSSPEVQAAIAGILIRADFAAIARPEVVETLRQHRLGSAEDDLMIDALIRRLQAPL